MTPTLSSVSVCTTDESTLTVREGAGRDDGTGGSGAEDPEAARADGM